MLQKFEGQFSLNCLITAAILVLVFQSKHKICPLIVAGWGGISVLGE